MRLAVNGARAAAVALATGGLAGGLLVASTTAAHAVQNADVDQDYNCNATAGGLPLGNYVVGVNTVAVLPDSYTPGGTIPGQTIQVNLNLPEDLRDTTVTTTGGQSADGGSDDTALGLKNSGVTNNVPVLNLASDGTSPIPQQENVQWTVPASGQVPTVPVPAQASGPTQVLAPAAFTVDATIYTGPNGTGTAIPSTLDCQIVSTDTGYRRVGVVQQDGQTPTGAAPVAEDVDVTTTAGKSVDITIPDATDADSPAAELGYQAEGTPENGRLIGAGQDLTYLPEDGFTGTDSFDYTVSDQTGNTDTATVTVEVGETKAESKTAATAPKRAKAGKPVKVSVKVTSDPAATGTVTVSLGKKKLDSGKVKNGKATLVIPAKSTKAYKGKKTFTVKYSGSDSVKSSSDKVTVTFTK